MTTLLTEAQTADKMVNVAREQVDAFSNGDWERLRAGLASDARYDEFGTDRKVEGPEQIVELFKGWKQAFPDAAGTVKSALASGDTAVLEVMWTGTHTGPLTTAEGTIPASGKRQETPGAIFFTFEGDKIKESRQYFDSLTLLKQIGGSPSNAHRVEQRRGRPPVRPLLRR
jgi:steroid delta-isomerase-like uncharacterized protein